MKNKILFVFVLAFAFFSSAVFSVPLEELIIVSDDGKFLGSFEDQYATNSVYNKYGTYGSKFDSSSIFNKYGDYGSDYSDKSPFNDYANKAPWLMDRNGRRYGRLSTNRYASGVTNYSYNLACRLRGIRDSM